MIYNHENRRKDVLKSMICDEKLLFSTSIVEYNRHKSESNENAQQRSYYSSHRFDRRYWWSLFIFLLDAIVLNAFKLWDQLYFDFKLTHSKFQYQIAKILLTNEITRKHTSNLSVDSTDKKKDTDQQSSCEWEHADKKSYCRFCREKKTNLRKRRAFEEISDNFIKKQRTSQISWQCKRCDLCCKKKDCWRALHSSFNA
jgi:hypothetical protein